MPILEKSPEQIVVQRGYWIVTFPSWLLGMGFMWSPVLFLGVEAAFNTPRGLWSVGIGIALGIATGWVWWSVAAPRWRLWAYPQVTDLRLLEQLAVAEKLVWPIRHPLTRTELRFGPLGEQLRAYEATIPEQDVR